MPGSAKRYGLDVKDNLELEIRLRRIEQALEQKADANIDSTSSSRARSVVPQVTGLSLVGKTPGAATIKWNAVPIPDLKRYEVNLAEDLAFTINVQKPNVAGTEFNFSTISTTGGGGDTTFFAKVRARNLIDQVGPFSVILNTTTGQAQTSDIADEAVTIVQIDDESAGSLTTAQVQALIDASTAGLISASSVPGYINELTLSINGGDAKTLDFAVGVAADSTDTLIMESTSAFVKDLEVAWAEGTAQGGLGDGLTLTADTWYHAFMIAKTDGTVDFGVDTSVTAVNLLVSATDYTLFRRIGSVQTNPGDTDIKPFSQLGDHFSWITGQHDGSATGSATRVLLTISTPLGVITYGRFRVGARQGNSMLLVVQPVEETSGGPSQTAPPIATVRAASGGEFHASEISGLKTDALSRIAWEADANSGEIDILTIGWMDLRGKDGQ